MSEDFRWGRRVDSVLELVGATPLVRLNRVVPDDAATIFVKLESANPGGSVKDRIALSMIEAAEAEGVLQPGATIVESTSGNTGIGLAMVAVVKGYRCVIVMPETMSEERQQILKAYGAEVVLTPAEESMHGSNAKAREIAEATPGAFMPWQWTNPANPEVHRRTTAREILHQTEGKLDAFVAGVGTGGTITGCGEVLREHLPGLLVAAVQPAASPLLTGGEPGPHMIQGIGAPFIPGVLNCDIFSRVISVSDYDAHAMEQRLAREEGLLAGTSAGANVFAACQVAAELGSGHTAVTIACDSGERYFSVADYFPPRPRPTLR